MKNHEPPKTAPFRAIALLAALLAPIACSSPDELGDGGDETGEPPTDGINPAAACGASTRTYKGFDGVDLAATRTQAQAASNRVRLKPYPLLYGEFERVLGKLPAEGGKAFLDAADSFDLAKPRFFIEPKATGVGMTAWFDVAFTLSELHVKANAAKYAALPTAETARTVCEEMTNAAWQRRASEAELNACIDFATTKIPSEKTPSRAWAYVVASVLSSADFLSY